MKAATVMRVPRAAVLALAAGVLLQRRTRAAAARAHAAEHQRRGRTLASACVNVEAASKPGLGVRWPHTLSAVSSGERAAATAALLMRSYARLAHSMWVMLAVSAALFKKLFEQALPRLQLVTAHADAATRPAIELETVHSMCGSWTKDSRRSEPMDPFCELFGVPRWLRQATRLMGGLDVSMAGEDLLVRQVCRLSWLSTSEAFPLDGVRTGQHKRRDMRSGTQTGKLLEARGGTMMLRAEFGGKAAGHATDTLELRAGGEELLVHHEACIVGRGCAAFTEVYTRRGVAGGDSRSSRSGSRASNSSGSG